MGFSMNGITIYQLDNQFIHIGFNQYVYVDYFKCSKKEKSNA